jgi:cobalt-zinc-cadmium efflux system outer membrane protein
MESVTSTNAAFSLRCPATITDVMRALAGVASMVALMVSANAAAAAEPPNCHLSVQKDTVVPCAIRASLDVRGEQAALRALDGARVSAGVLLPSNPSLSLSGGQAVTMPWATGNLVWGATLSQELEIGGQRARRLDVVASSTVAQERRILGRARQVAADALSAYFDVLAASEEKRLTERLARISEALRTYAAARASAGLTSPVDATAARAAAVRLETARLEAEQRFLLASAALTTLLGLDPAHARVAVSGELAPLVQANLSSERLVERGLAQRADLQVASAEREAQERRRALFRSLRMPNPTVSAFLRNDWIEERTAGIGIALPIPLPNPVGRTYAGEMAEAEALADRAKNDVERLRRNVRLEITKALVRLDVASKEVALFRQDDLTRAEAALDAIADELKAQRLAIRDALLTEQTLLEYLLARVAAQRALCQASVEMARASGEPLERGVP